MTPLDLLGLFDKSAGTYALVATYEFDPFFFERRLLHTRGFAAASRILVLMDRGRYQDLVNQGLIAGGFNRRYLVAPIDRAPFVFHPKLYLVLGPERAVGVVGSSNSTSAGIAYNMELCSAFSAQGSAPHANDAIALPVLRQVYDAIKTFAADTGPVANIIDEKFFKPIEEDYAWLDRGVVSLNQNLQIDLLHSHKEPLWPEIVKRLEGKKVRKITILSPFFDQNLGLLKKVRTQWPLADIVIVAQPKYATLAAPKLRNLLQWRAKDSLLEANPKPGRRLHAKLFGFETATGTFWLAGSPNATLAAIDGKNTESALWFSTPEPAAAILSEDAFSLAPIDPDEFEPGVNDEPRNTAPTLRKLTIASATLQETGDIEIEYDAVEDIQNLTLRVTNANEPLPALSLPVRGIRHGKERIDLDSDQLSQIRAAAACELKGDAGGVQEFSNRVALIQLAHVLRDPSSSGSDARNPLRKVTETGEGLVPYMDSLGSVRDVVDFLNQCSIRFEDGTRQNRGFSSARWKPRDPFTGDTPPQWLAIPAGSSAVELRKAIWDFVERHQHDKLEKHVRRGNLNGLPNFIDIFRTLNGLLLTYHNRSLDKSGPVIPFPYVITGILKNLSLFIGDFEPGEDACEGFVASIEDNLEGDLEIVRERLEEERVPQMLWAAMEAVIDVRKQGLKLANLDNWSVTHLRWISAWIEGHGLHIPSAEDVRAAGLEYRPAA